MIHLNDVSKRYRDGELTISALTGLTLAIPKGSATALVGTSGSGKSTLLHLMGGLEHPDTGRVTIMGADLSDLPDRELTLFRLRQIGFVFQFFHLIPSLTVQENLLLPTELAGWPRGKRLERARDCLADVGLSERAATFPEQLSGGEQQRIAVARALLLNPPLLLADEPTGNLDSETGGRVLDLLWSLSEDRGTTLVVATHSLDVAERCGRRIELKDGRLLSDSAPASLPGIQDPSRAIPAGT